MAHRGEKMTARRRSGRRCRAGRRKTERGGLREAAGELLVEEVIGWRRGATSTEVLGPSMAPERRGDGGGALDGRRRRRARLGHARERGPRSG